MTSPDDNTGWGNTDWPDPEIFDTPTEPASPRPWKLIAPAFLLGIGFTLVILKLLGAL